MIYAKDFFFLMLIFRDGRARLRLNIEFVVEIHMVSADAVEERDFIFQSHTPFRGI